jgi:NTP pyrophosphatase (non-canonical NTP hydrolase)
MAALREELGDLLLQVVFHARKKPLALRLMRCVEFRDLATP